MSKHLFIALTVIVVAWILITNITEKIYPSHITGITIELTTPPDTIPVPVPVYRDKKDSSAHWKGVADSLLAVLRSPDTMAQDTRDSIIRSLALPWKGRITDKYSSNYFTVIPTNPPDFRMILDSTTYSTIRIDTLWKSPEEGVKWYWWVVLGIAADRVVESWF